MDQRYEYFGDENENEEEEDFEMTVDEQTKLLLKALEPWAADNGGSLKVASDKAHLFQLLGT